MMRSLPILLLVLICGCASPSLVHQMQDRGITHHNTSKIVLIGSESDVGSDIKVEIGEAFLVQEIWDAIYQSRPHDLWYASGYRRADFYVDASGVSAGTLWINESDTAFLEGMEAHRFRCPKLHERVMSLLQDELDRRKKSPIAHE